MTESTRDCNTPAEGALFVEHGFAELFASNGLRTLDDLFAQNLGQRLGKPGLETWRERIRFSLARHSDGREDATVVGAGSISGRPPGLKPAALEEKTAARGFACVAIEAAGDTDTPVVLYAKRYRAVPARARRGIGGSGSRARSLAGVEWAWLHRLKQAGVDCAEPVAFGEEVRGGREVRSVVVTREAPGKSLETWCDEWLREPSGILAPRGLKPAGQAEKPAGQGETALRQRMVVGNLSVREVAHHVAGVIARLHDAGLFHRDLYLCHIFCDGSAPLGESVRLIDLHRVVAPAWGLRRWRVKDLAALNYSTPPEVYSRSDRLRWLKQYLDVSKLDRDARRLVYRIIGKTCAIARHDRKRRASMEATGVIS